MKSCRSNPIIRMSRGRVAAGLFLAVLLATGRDGLAGKRDSGSPAGTPGPKFNVPIPVNHGAMGVKLPYFDDRGRLQMFFNIATAFRTDIGHLEMGNAYMQTYDETQAPDANVFMTRSVLDLNTRIVTSDVPVVVRRRDFEITGQKMVFNTQTRVGRMTGHVRMVIYNRQTAEPSPTPAPAPAGK